MFKNKSYHEIATKQIYKCNYCGMDCYLNLYYSNYCKNIKNKYILSLSVTPFAQE